VLLQAFLEEFGGDNDVELHVHTHKTFRSAANFPGRQPPDPSWDDATAFRYFSADRYQQWNYSLPNVTSSFLRRIVGSTETRALQDMPCQMSKFDAFVLPTRGEGWGLPIMEAMAVGLPVIVTNFSAMLDYVHEEWGYPIAYTLAPAEGPSYDDTGGRWAIASKSDLRRLMRHVVMNPVEAHGKGLKGQEFVHKHYHQEACGHMALERLAALMDRP
jgi:glycosyltransferase involved in cell wall biosynthesis